jgi:hypothetical protein
MAKGLATRPMFSLHDRCLARKLFPSEVGTQTAEYGIAKLVDLASPGLGAGIEKAGPIGFAGAVAGSVVGCEKELGVGNF